MQIEDTIKSLKKIIQIQIKKKNFENAVNTAITLSEIYYNYNQIYTDSELENDLLIVRDAVLDKKKYEVNENCVFFYDGFGLDLRGIAAVYIRALTNLDYQVIYACPENMKEKIPHILAELNIKNSHVIYIDKKNTNIERIQLIDSIFTTYKPNIAFFYTYPFDVEGALAFSNNFSTIKIQLDLTDHAFWIGTNAFDYIVNGRELGASIAYYERGISKEHIIKLDCTPYINKDKCKTRFPIDIKKEKYIFTGGALYKTLGDKELLYYKTIDSILFTFSDIKFIYAGNGDDKEIKKLILKYPNRVFLINECPDFYELIKYCVIYINSYPMFGGLMMRYAALAGKIPITLKHDNDADGILINQTNLGIEYENYEEYINEIYKLLSNEEYRIHKEQNLIGAVMTEVDFTNNVRLLIKEQRTKFKFDELKRYDTSEFKKECKIRYAKTSLYKSIAKITNIDLIRYFPKEFILGTLITIKEKIIK